MKEYCYIVLFPSGFTRGFDSLHELLESGVNGYTCILIITIKDGKVVNSEVAK